MKEQGCGGFSLCSRNADEGESVRGMPVKGGGEDGERVAAIRHIGDLCIGRQSDGIFTEEGAATAEVRRVDIRMPVTLCTAQTDKE